MDFLATMDGAMTLAETESACEVEQDAGFQLDSIQFGTVMKDGDIFLINKAAFNEKLFGRLKNLSFVQVIDADNPGKLREKAETEGWTFICDSQIYVQNNTRRVMVFGKKTF